MENIEDKKSGFRVLNIMLAESHLTRIGNVDFQDSKRMVSFETGVGGRDNKINVRLKTTVVNMKDGSEQYRIEVSMIGVFERNGNSQISTDEEFGRVNGAAIIFPFVREHIANIALKAGLGSIILPPVNFTKVNKDKTNNK